MPLTRRVIALDAGTQTIRALLLEEFLGTVRVVRSASLERVEMSDDEGPDESVRIRQMLEELGDWPVAIVLSQSHVTSQVIEVPGTTSDPVERFLDDEAAKLRGLSESLVVHDHSPLPPFGKFRNPYWVTLCLETEIFRQFHTAGLTSDTICEVTPAADALFHAFRATCPPSPNVLLVNIGAAGTLVVLIHEGKRVAAGTASRGGDAITEELARLTDGDWARAEQEKRSAQLAEGSEVGAALRRGVDAWWSEVARLRSEWMHGLGLAEANNPPVTYLSGGGSKLGGLAAYLESRSGGIQFKAWPASDDLGLGAETAGFEQAYGIGNQLLGSADSRTSLLPDEVQDIWKDRLSLSRLQSAGLFVITIATILLLLASGRKVMLASEKNRLLSEARKANRMLDASEQLYRTLHEHYEQVRPWLTWQTNTVETLRTLELLGSIATNQPFWLVLFADHATYLTKPAGTNSAPLQPVSPWNGTNSRSYVAELTIPLEGEAMRQALADIVNRLKKTGRYTTVDVLPVEGRRRWVDPAYQIADKTFTLGITPIETPLGKLPAAQPGEPKRKTPSSLRETLQGKAARSESRNLPPEKSGDSFP